MDTVVYVPIRAYQEAEGDTQYAVVEWIAEGQSESYTTLYDDSCDSSPYFLNADSDLIIRRTDEGNLVCDLFANPDMNGDGDLEAEGIPFVIRSPEHWPDEWLEIGS